MTPSNPLVEHIAVLRKRLGSREPFHAEVCFDDLGTTTAHALDDLPVVVDLTLESIADGLVAAGTVAFTWEGDCRRCLDPVRGEETVEVREIFSNDPVEGETWPIGPDSIDLEPVVRESVLVNLPLAPLCDHACSGPAPDQFPATVEGQVHDGADDGQPAKDPRWAALDAVEFDQ